MSITKFLHKDNLKILCDVIFDEDIIKKQTREFQENIYNLFMVNSKGFYEVESKNITSLVDMNKKYILLILNHANKSIQKTGISEYKKIKILDEEPKNGNELITYEEIQNDKRSQFDRDLNKRQDEFTSAMTLPVPPVPKFSDNLEDGPISEMEKAIQEITAQRNYDVEQINKNNNNSIISSNVDNWLKPQETSVKTDKLSHQVQINTNNNISNNRIKREEESTKKNVTWGKNEVYRKNEVYNKNEANEIKLEIEEIEEKGKEQDSDNIFKLFKRVPLPIVDKKENNQTNEDKILILQQDVKNLNNKLDNILDLLNRIIVK